MTSRDIIRDLGFCWTRQAIDQLERDLAQLSMHTIVNLMQILRPERHGRLSMGLFGGRCTGSAPPVSFVVLIAAGDLLGENLIEPVAKACGLCAAHAEKLSVLLGLGSAIMVVMKTLAIIGGGASGLAAAIAAGREARDRGEDVEVVLYEADERVGRSVLATGNGRCNFSNAHIDVTRYRNARFVTNVLESLQTRTAHRGCAMGDSNSPLDSGDTSGDPVHRFFYDLGLCWREEGEGRLYPYANKASSVLDVLRAGAAEAGLLTRCGRRVVRVDAPHGAERFFHLRFSDGAVEHADAVVVAVSGRAIERLELPGGLLCVPTKPVLGPLRTEASLTRQLNNIRVRCAAVLESPDGKRKAREVGEVLFRDYGVSGIVVFNLSREASPGDVVCLDFFPDLSALDLESFFVARARRIGGETGGVSYERLLCGLLLPQVADAILKQVGLRGVDATSKSGLARLASTLKRLSLEVRGIGDAKQCQVTRGGLDVAGFDSQTLGAQGLRGLFAAGEALDVDGPCGGYNLHWAWASGIVAGQGAISYLQNQAAS